MHIGPGGAQAHKDYMRVFEDLQKHLHGGDKAGIVSLPQCCSFWAEMNVRRIMFDVCLHIPTLLAGPSESLP